MSSNSKISEKYTHAETGEVQEFLSRAKLSRASRLKYEYLSTVVLYIKNESVS